MKRRVGLILRLVIVAVAAVIIFAEGNAAAEQAINGQDQHYIVFLTSDSDPHALATAQAKQDGLKVEEIIDTASVKAYTATIPSKKVSQLQNESQVAYVQLDSQQQIHHSSFWDTTKIVLTELSPHIS